MSGVIDLHTHSSASDGSMNPAELIKHAKASGLSSISLTDHDTIDGVAEAINEGKNIDVEVIPGIEIGVDFEREMHILGYFNLSNYLNISKKLLFLRENREERNYKTIRKLNELGFCIKMEEVRAKSDGNIIGRPHIAKVMHEKGYVNSMEDAFDKYLAYGRPAYFKKDKMTPKEGIEEILNAGGIPVLAHPIMLHFNYLELDNLLKELSFLGLKGVEAYYTENTDVFTFELIELAKRYNLLITGGTDFHGSFKPDIKIGKGYGNLSIPKELLLKLKEALNWSA